MNIFERPQGSDLARAREIFCEAAATAALMTPPASEGRRRVSAGALYAAARDGTDGFGADESHAARKFYSRAVAETAAYSLAEARAASTGGPAARHGEGCHIRFERSRAEPNQYFVMVELARERDEESPTSLVVCDHEQRCRRFPLPAARDGIAQIIADADSDLVRLIGDPSTRVYLR